MFTQPCFIEKDTLELRRSIELLGYKYVQSPTYRGTLFANNGFYSDSLPYNAMLIDESIDCGENESLFLAIAALRDDTDKDQWFVLETNLSSLDNPPKISHEIGSLVKCNRDKWFIDIDSNGKPLSVSSRNTPAHKATVEELIEHFNRKTYTIKEKH